MKIEENDVVSIPVNITGAKAPGRILGRVIEVADDDVRVDIGPGFDQKILTIKSRLVTRIGMKDGPLNNDASFDIPESPTNDVSQSMTSAEELTQSVMPPLQSSPGREQVSHMLWDAAVGPVDSIVSWASPGHTLAITLVACALAAVQWLHPLFPVLGQVTGLFIGSSTQLMTLLRTLFAIFSIAAPTPKKRQSPAWRIMVVLVLIFSTAIHQSAATDGLMGAVAKRMSTWLPCVEDCIIIAIVGISILRLLLRR